MMYSEKTKKEIENCLLGFKNRYQELNVDKYHLLTS